MDVRDLFDIAHVRPGGQIMLLKAYLDESRYNDGPVCAIAGFAGTEEQWGAFEPAWLDAIAPRSSLHMRDLRWNTKPDRLKALLIRAGAVPDQFTLGRVAATVRRKDYDDFVAGTDLELVLDPYMACFTYCLKAMLGGIRQDQRLHVFMEQQDTYRPKVELYYDEVFRVRGADHRLVGLTFLGKDEAIGFQPADYLAFHVAKYKADQSDSKAVLTRPIYGNGQGVGWNMTRDEMRSIAERTRESWRVVDELEENPHALHKRSLCGD